MMGTKGKKGGERVVCCSVTRENLPPCVGESSLGCVSGSEVLCAWPLLGSALPTWGMLRLGPEQEHEQYQKA